MTGWLLAFAAGVVIAYLMYAVFERWSYLRFLLPAQAVTAALAGVLLARAVWPAPASPSGLIAAATVIALLASGVSMARRLEVFQVASAHARVVEAGDALRRVLPENAVLLASEQSGSMRHETAHPVVRWDALTTDQLRQVLLALETHGHEPWWVLDQWEEAIVRSRFATLPEAALDWPPRVEGGRLMRTRAWRLADRPR